MAFAPEQNTPPSRWVIPAEAAGSFTVRCAVEGPPNFAFPPTSPT